MSLDDLMIELKAKGNWGHGGRPGKRGGSTSKVGSGSTSGKVSDQSTSAERDGIVSIPNSMGGVYKYESLFSTRNHFEAVSHRQALQENNENGSYSVESIGSRYHVIDLYKPQK